MTEDEILKQYGYVEPRPKKKQAASSVLSDENEILRQYGYESPESEETYQESIQRAPRRILSDLGDVILKRIHAIPQSLEKAKTEIPGFVKSVATTPEIIGMANPIAFGAGTLANTINQMRNPNQPLGTPFERQAIAGGNEAINTLAQTPLSLAKYGADRLHLLSGSVPNAISKVTPEDTTSAINQLFGEPNAPGEAAVRGLARNVPNLVPGVGLAEKIGSYVNSLNIPRALKSTKGLKSQLNKATEELSGAELLEQQQKNVAMQEHGVGNINSLIYRKKEAERKLNNLYTELNANPPKTLDEHLKASNDLAKLQKEHADARESLDQAKSAAIQEPGVKTANPDVIIAKMNEKQNKLNQLQSEARNGQPITNEQLTQAQTELDSARAEFEQHKNVAESNFGSAKQNSLQLKINNNTKEINDLNEKLADQKEIINKSFPEGETKIFEQKKIPVIAEFAENEKRASAYHDNAREMVAKVENEVSKHVNPNADHAVRASREMKHEITSINDYWSSAYKNLVTKLKNTKFKLTNQGRIPNIQKEVAVLRSNEVLKANNEFNQLMQKAPTHKDISASDFMSKQKDFRDARYDLLQRAKNEPSAVKRKELFEAYDQSAGIDKIINQTLEEGLGEHLSEYKRINQGYSNEVFPLRDNPTATKIMNGQPMSSNIAHELSGDQEGQALLREIALRNNEVKRNIMGQQYKKATKDKSGFYNPDETVREYSNTMPELNKLMGKRENAVNFANEAKTNLDESKRLHDEAKSNNDKIAKDNERIAKDKEKYDLQEKKRIEKQRITQEKENVKISKENVKISKEKEQRVKEIKALEEKNTLLGGIKLKLAESSEKMNKIESYHKELSELKTHQDNTHVSINEIRSDLKTLDKHLNAIKSANEKLNKIALPEKAKAVKAPDIGKMKQEAKDIHEKILKLDENTKKLQEASKNTNMKLAKKLEIEKSLDEAKAIKKEAKRKLIIAGTVILPIAGMKYSSNIKDYLLNKQ